MTDVIEISKKKGLVLVEWRNEEGGIFRNWITPDIIETNGGSKLQVDNPGMGIPFGVNFSEYLPYPEDVVQDIDRELKRLGIWTWDDVLARRDLVKQAYQNVLAIRVADLLAVAVKEQKQSK
jgi:hypothetical protein